MPIQRRLPKFGFKNPNRVEFKPVNLDTLQALAEKTGSTVISREIMLSNGLIGKNDKIKVLSRGELTTAVEVSADAFSAKAAEAIEKAGGKAVKL